MSAGPSAGVREAAAGELLAFMIAEHVPIAAAAEGLASPEQPSAGADRGVSELSFHPDPSSWLKSRLVTRTCWPRLHRASAIQSSPTCIASSFVAPMRARKLYRYERSHPSLGSASRAGSNSFGTSGTYGNTEEWFVSYSWLPVKTLLDTRVSLISIVALPGHQSAIRVDAQVTWLPAKIEAIREFVNQLGVLPPGVRSCPIDFGQHLTISFRKQAQAKPLAVVVADAGGCEDVQVQRFGHAVTPALSGYGLVPFVERELGFS